MNYHFDLEHAKKYGAEEAILLQNFIFWIRHNKANGTTHDRDGRTWTYNSQRALGVLFPFWTRKQIRRILDSLIVQGVLILGEYNKAAYDKTSWYALSDESILQLDAPKEDESIGPNGPIDVPESANGLAQTGGPIPDLNPDKKPEREKAHRTAEALPLPVGATAPERPPSPFYLVEKMKAEAQARRAPLVIGRDWTAGLAELVKAGTTEAELLEAFTTCIEAAPERVSFFPRDFLKWRKASRAHEERRPRPVNIEEIRERERRAAEERAAALAGPRLTEADTRSAWARIARGDVVVDVRR